MFITPYLLQFSLYLYSLQNNVGHWHLLVFFDITPSSFTISMLCWPWATTHAIIVLSIFWMNPSILNHPLSDTVKAKRYRWMWCGFQGLGALHLDQIWLWKCGCSQRNMFFHVLVGSFTASWWWQSSLFIWTLCSTRASLVSSDFITQAPVTPASGPGTCE